VVPLWVASSFSSMNKAWCLGEFHLLHLLPSTSPVDRGGEGRGRDADNLGLGSWDSPGSETFCCICKLSHSGPLETTDLRRESACSKISSARDTSRLHAPCPCLCWSTSDHLRRQPLDLEALL
jgi:hypothetical protein